MRLPLFVCLIVMIAGLSAGDARDPAPKEIPPALWPQWRGPNRDGIVGGPAWPDTLKDKILEPIWRVEVGEGYPGPVVAADRVFVAETKGGKKEVVRALDRKTGKQMWEHSWTGSMSVPFFARSNGSWIRATPAYDGESLYVAGIRDVLVCIDAANGKERWKADLRERHKTGLPAFGFVCSPLVEGDAVYVQAASSFLKLDKKTGKTVWRTLVEDTDQYGSAFSSPIIATLAGKRQVVVQTRTVLAGVEMAEGKALWKQPIPANKGMNILTPTVYKDAVFTSAYGAKTYRYDIKKGDDGLAVSNAWTLPIDAYMSSPVVVGKHAYMHLKNQRVACVDLETGKPTWTTTKAYGKYWSMVAQGDKILALDQRGTLYLLKANPEKFELLDERPVSKQETWGHLAVAGDEVFVRELKAISAFRWKAK